MCCAGNVQPQVDARSLKGQLHTRITDAQTTSHAGRTDTASSQTHAHNKVLKHGRRHMPEARSIGSAPSCEQRRPDIPVLPMLCGSTNLFAPIRRQAPTIRVSHQSCAREFPALACAASAKAPGEDAALRDGGSILDWHQTAWRAPPARAGRRQPSAIRNAVSGARRSMHHGTYSFLAGTPCVAKNIGGTNKCLCCCG